MFYFDNVGGSLQDAALLNLRLKGRMIICGQISQYHLTERATGPRLYGRLMFTQGSIYGFVVEQFADRYNEGIEQLSQWLAEGKLRHWETVVEGFEETPRDFIAMMKGQNQSKAVVRIG